MGMMSTEAEVKAAAMAAEDIVSVVPLWSVESWSNDEVAHHQLPSSFGATTRRPGLTSSFQD